MIDRDEFRDAMALLPAAVTILTSGGPAGEAGLTATAVASVTDDPVTLLVCINRASQAHDVFLRNGVFCVNCLAAGQQAAAELFAAEPSMAARFAAFSWRRLISVAPALEGAAVVFDCHITAASEVGTHSVIFGAVQAVATAPRPTGLLYYGRAYRPLAPE